MQFIVTAQKENSAPQDIVRDAKDKYEAARMARKDGFVVLTVREASSLKNASVIEKLTRATGGVNTRDRILFANNLSAMVAAGLPLARAIGVMERQARTIVFRDAIRDVGQSIDRGESLTSALARHKEIFKDEFVAIVAAGEESGTLPDSLRIIGNQLEKGYSLRKKIRGAMMYPAVILVAMFGIGMVMMAFVVPTLSTTFREFNAELPLITRLIIGLSDFMSAHFILSLFFVLVFVLLVVLGIRSEKGKRFYDRVSIRIPYVGLLSIEAQAAYTTRTLSSLIAAGVDIVEALKITEKVVTNSLHRDLISNAASVVQKGASLSSIFKEHPNLFPPLVPSMMEVGEETGKLADMLMKTAEFYEDEVDTATKNLSTIVEPVLMVFIGVAVGFFALAIMQPLYSIGDHI